jgi:hypothetical protein
LSYPADPTTFADLLRLAEDVIARRSRNFVNDALLLARWVLRDGKKAVDDRHELAMLIESIVLDPTPERMQAAVSITRGMIQ